MPENDGDGDQITLFPMRSELAAVKDGAGAVKVETVLDEIAKLQQLRALGLPELLFRDTPAKLVTHYRQRAASEPPRELTHPSVNPGRHGLYGWQSLVGRVADYHGWLVYPSTRASRPGLSTKLLGSCSWPWPWR